MGMFSYLFNRPDWYQKSKESKDGFISNFKPESRRYLNKERKKLAFSWISGF